MSLINDNRRGELLGDRELEQDLFGIFMSIKKKKKKKIVVNRLIRDYVNGRKSRLVASSNDCHASDFELIDMQIGFGGCGQIYYPSNFDFSG